VDSAGACVTKANPSDHIAKRMTRKLEVVRSAPRAIFGEGHWQRTTISATEDDEIRVESQPAEAPADNRPLLIPGKNDESHVRDIVEKFIEQGPERLTAIKAMNSTEREVAINELWQEYAEQLLLHRKGQSTVGLSGLHQRQRNDGRAAHGK